MKVLAIRGEGLASLADPFEIRFDEGPLGAAGLFAITGATGAGKSTLLDALCLALYDKTPRLRDAKSGAPVGRPEDDEKDRMGQQDVRTVLARGAASAFAEVDFVGRDRRTWRARWQVHRARRRLDGRVGAQALSLRDLETDRDVSGSGKRETLRAIEERVGLGFEQLRRSVLLAQGDFAAFLKAEVGERAELLERMTRTAIYGAVSIVVHRRHREEAEGLEALARDLGALALLTVEEREALAAGAAEKTAARDGIREEVRALEAALAWYALERELCVSVEDGRRAAATAAAAVEVAGPRREAVERARAVEPLRHPLEAAARARSEAEKAAGRVEEARAAVEAAREVAESAAGAASLAKTALESAGGARDSARPDLERARVLDRDLGIARTAAGEAAAKALALRRGAEAFAREAEALSLDAARRLAAADRKLADLEDAARESAGAAESLAEAERALAAAREAAGGLDGEALRGKRDALRDEIGRLEKVADAAGRAARARDGLDLLERSHAEAAARLEESETQVSSLDVARSLSDHRAELVPGKPCPLCGATEHPWAGGGPLGAALDDLRRRRDELRVEASKLSREVAGRRARAEDADRDLAKLSEPGAPPPDLSRLEPLRADLGRVEALEAQVSRLEKAEANARRADDEARKTRTKLERHREKLADFRSLVSDLPAVDGLSGAVDPDPPADLPGRLGVAREKAAAAHRDAGAAENAAVEANARAAELETARAALLGGRAVEEVETALRKALEAAKRQAEEATRASDTTGLQLARAEEAAKAAEATRAKCEEAARAERESLDLALATAGLSEEEVKAALGAGGAWLAEETEALRRLDEEAAKQRAVLAERERRLAAHRETAAPSRDEPSAREAAAEAGGRLAAVEEELASLRFRLEEDGRRRARAGEIEVELAERSKAVAVWSRLHDLVGSADGKKLRTFAQGLTLEALLAHANRHLADLAPRYVLQRIPGHDLELQVLDRDLGDEVRSVHSLSGGETFLVSLALALGLASLSSADTPVETLFIDEGFGSLDPDTLETALAALDALQATGRKVGIISHVEGLAEHIGTGVRVEKTGGGRSRVVVFG